MAVKKKPVKKAAPKSMPAELDPKKIEKDFKESQKEVNKRELAQKKREEVLANVAAQEKQLAPKRIAQVLKNDLVKVEVLDDRLPIDPVPMSAVAIDGLMEFVVHGTHLRLLAMIDPRETPNLEQRVAMAKRLNEVGPYLPRYIKTIELKKPAPGITSEDVEESKGLAKDRAEAQAKAPQSPTEAPEHKGRVKRRREEGKTSESGQPKATAAAIPNGVPLKKICASINVEPKLARRVLRAKGSKPGGRWEWPEKEVEAIKKLIADGVKELEKKGG